MTKSSQRALKVLHNEEISGGGKNGEEKGVGFAILRRRANRGAQTPRKESEEELLGVMLTLI